MSAEQILQEFRALSAGERKRVAEVILTEEDSWIPESFRQGMEDFTAGRVMEMDDALSKTPPRSPKK